MGQTHSVIAKGSSSHSKETFLDVLAHSLGVELLDYAPDTVPNSTFAITRTFNTAVATVAQTCSVVANVIRPDPSTSFLDAWADLLGIGLLDYTTDTASSSTSQQHVATSEPAPPSVLTSSGPNTPTNSTDGQPLTTPAAIPANGDREQQPAVEEPEEALCLQADTQTIAPHAAPIPSIVPANSVLSITPITTIFSIPDSSCNTPTNSQFQYSGNVESERNAVAAVDSPNVDVLLARIAELEGIVNEQRTCTEMHASQTTNDDSNAKVWRNCSTTPVEAIDASAWAEAAYISQANTLGDKDRKIKEQDDSVRQLLARVSDSDRKVEEQNDKIRELQAQVTSTGLRGTFKRTDAAIKDSAKVIQLQEELKTEKAGRAADAEKAVKALAESKEQSQAEIAAMAAQHQSDISTITTTQLEMEKKVKDVEGQLSKLKKEDIARSERNKKLITERDVAINKYHAVVTRCETAITARKEQQSEFEVEKQRMEVEITRTKQELTTAQDEVKSLERKNDNLQKMSDAQDDTLEAIGAENEEKDGEIASLKVNNEDLKAKVKDLQAENSKTCIENIGLLITINAERKERVSHEDRIKADHDARHEADIRSLQRDVFSRDQQLRNLEKEMQALRLQLAGNAIAAVSPTSSVTPTAPLSVKPASSSNLPRSFTPPASSVPLPPSPAASLSSTTSSRPLQSSAPLSPSKDAPLPTPPAGWDQSLMKTDLPLEHSTSGKAEVPVQPSSLSVTVEDGSESDEIAQHTDVLSTAAAHARLITWPHSIPTLSITWRDEPTPSSAVAETSSQEALPAPNELPVAGHIRGQSQGTGIADVHGSTNEIKADAAEALEEDSSNDKKSEVVNSDQPTEEAPREKSFVGGEDKASTDPASVPADGTVSALVSDSSIDKKQEEVHDIDDEPMRDAPRGSAIIEDVDMEEPAPVHMLPLLNNEQQAAPGQEFDQKMVDTAPTHFEEFDQGMLDTAVGLWGLQQGSVQPTGEEQTMGDAPHVPTGDFSFGQALPGFPAFPGFGQGFPDVAEQPQPMVQENESHEANMTTLLGGDLDLVRAWNESHDASGTPVDKLPFGSGVQPGTQAPIFSGFGQASNEQSGPLPAFSFGQNMPAQQTVFPNLTGFGPQFPQPAPTPSQFIQPASFEPGSTEIQSQYPDLTGLGWESAEPTQWAAGGEEPANTVDEMLMKALRDHDAMFPLQGADAASSRENYDRLQRPKRPLPKRSGRPLVATPAHGVPAVQPIFGDILVTMPGQASGQQEQPEQVRPAPANSHINRYCQVDTGQYSEQRDTGTDNLGPQLLSNPPPPQPKPEEQIRPASPTDPAALDAEYDSDKEKAELLQRLMDASSEEGGNEDAGRKAENGQPGNQAIDQGKQPEPDLPEYEDPQEGQLVNEEPGNEQTNDPPAPTSFAVNPFTGNTFPQYQTLNASPRSNVAGSSRMPSSRHPTTPEQASPETSSQEKAVDAQSSQGVPAKLREIKPLPRRRPRPAAADFFDIKPQTQSQPPVATVEGASNESTNNEDESVDTHGEASAPRKVLRPQTPLPPKTSCSLPAESNKGVLPGLMRPLEPEDSLGFQNSDCFAPTPDNFTARPLNDIIQAQRDVKKAARESGDQDGIESDEDEQLEWEEHFPAEPVAGSRGNGTGRKRRSSEAGVQYWNRDGADDKPVNRAPLYDPSSIKGLGPEELKGTIETFGSGSSIRQTLPPSSSLSNTAPYPNTRPQPPPTPAPYYNSNSSNDINMDLYGDVSPEERHQMEEAANGDTDLYSGNDRIPFPTPTNNSNNNPATNSAQDAHNTARDANRDDDVNAGGDGADSMDADFDFYGDAEGQDPIFTEEQRRLANAAEMMRRSNEAYWAAGGGRDD
ncbi:MAG: hypothetical protein Q9171_001564 [Xanthocarpia ochracea]